MTALRLQDAFHGVGDDDSLLIKANENENELKELRTFTDLIHSKNKVRMAEKIILQCAYISCSERLTASCSSVAQL